MHVSTAEVRAIKATISYGCQFGFGNLIAHLQTAWAETLMKQYGMDEKTARDATARDGSGYPFTMQQDIVDHGEWDETGARYRST